MGTLAAMSGAFFVVAAFALGAFLGLYAGSKGAYPHRAVKEEAEAEEDKLTLEKQFENMMNYGGGEQWNR